MTLNKKPEKQLALTGATGFVGHAIMTTALEAGYKVRALTRRPVEVVRNVEWIRGDLDNRPALEELVTGADACIHCAGLVKARAESDFSRINRDAVGNLVALSQKSHPKAGFHFVLVSSLAARHPDLSPYAKSKREGEERLKAENPDFPWTVVRPPAVYGPGDKEILKLFQTMKRGFAPVAGDDENLFSLIHARDLALAILSALHHQPAFGQTLEPDDKKPAGYTIKDVVGAAEEVLGRKIRTLEIPGPVLTLFAGANEMVARFSGEPAFMSRHKVREMRHPNWVADASTHDKIAHWKPAIDLKSGFRETVDWYRKRGLL